MKIKTVSCKKLVSTGNFSNISFGAEAEVELTQTPETAIIELACWVSEQLRSIGISNDEVRTINDEINSLENKKYSLEIDIKKLNEKRIMAIEILNRHGVDTSDLNDLPF